MLKQVPIRLEEDFVKQIKIICVKKGVTFQEVAKKLFEKWVEDNEGKQ